VDRKSAELAIEELASRNDLDHRSTMNYVDLIVRAAPKVVSMRNYIEMLRDAEAQHVLDALQKVHEALSFIAVVLTETPLSGSIIALLIRTGGTLYISS
jgi:hypothetical protein